MVEPIIRDEMTSLVVAYDTETPVSCLRACRRIVAIHRELDIPASFFVVGRLLESEGDAYRDLLLQPQLFEIASHTHSHGMIRDHPICGKARNREGIREEIHRSKETIERVFGVECLGLRPACSFDVGLRGAQHVLREISDAGYRYLSSQAWGEHFTVPAPLSQAYTYKDDGFPALWEFPCHGWHENLLKGHNATPGRLLLWPPVYPELRLTGYVETPEEEFDVHRFFIDRALMDGLEYVSLIWHPWSLYRFDPEMSMLRMVFEYARDRGMPFLRFCDLHHGRVASMPSR